MPLQTNLAAETNSTARKGLLRKLLGPWTFLLLALGLAGFYFLQLDRTQEEQERRQRPAKNVRTAVVAAKTLGITVQGVGSLKPVQTVQIKPEVSGKLKAVHFQEGSFVPKNELLFEIERTKLASRLASREAALKEARARLKNAQRNYERFSRLRSQDVVSEEDYDRVQTELEAVSAEVSRLTSEVELARLELKDSSIYAPFSGFISEKLVDQGSFVSVGEPLAFMYAIDPLEISFFVPEKYVGQVQSGQKVLLQVSAFSEETFQGQVHFVSPVVQETSRKFKVRALIDNPGHRLKPGSFASVQLVLAQRQDRPVIPETALVSTRQGYMVYVLDQDQNRVHSRQVQTGLREPGLVEINQGLRVGEIVVAAGHMALEDGSRVIISQEMSPNWHLDLKQQGFKHESRQSPTLEIRG